MTVKASIDSNITVYKNNIAKDCRNSNYRQRKITCYIITKI